MRLCLRDVKEEYVRLLSYVDGRFLGPMDMPRSQAILSVDDIEVAWRKREAQGVAVQRLSRERLVVESSWTMRFFEIAVRRRCRIPYAKIDDRLLTWVEKRDEEWHEWKNKTRTRLIS